VLSEGRIVGEFPGDAADRNEIGLLMGGRAADAAVAAD
jgi:hypothetical protein